MTFNEQLAAALRRLEKSLGNLNQVAVRLGVDRGGLQRFLNGERGLRSQTLEKILDGMGARITFDKASSGVEEPLSLLDQKIAQALNDIAQAFGKTPETLSAEAFNETIPPAKVRQMLAGELKIGAGDFYLICKALDISASKTLTRAEELIKEELSGEGTSKKSA